MGTQNKTAFNSAKKSAAALLARQYGEMIAAAEATGDEAEVDILWRRRADAQRVVSRLTRHWFCHMLATDLGRRDPRAAMRQGGWRDPRSLASYMMEYPEYQRALIEQRGLAVIAKAGTNLTRGGENGDAK